MDTSVDAIQICNLADDGASWAHMPVSKISIDPVLGRIAFPPGAPPQKVRVSFHYGFSMAMGGGEYERRASFAIDSDADVEIAQGDSIQTAFNSVAGGGVARSRTAGATKRHRRWCPMRRRGSSFALPMNIARHGF